LEKIRNDSEHGIIESDRLMIKAQEIILLARTRGDVAVGETTEKALKRAENAKIRHKNKEEAEREISI
jgi:hypothetical protein